MFRTLTTSAVIVASSISFVALAQAEDFPAAPMNPGPPSMEMLMPKPAMAPEAAPMEKPMMKKKHMSKKKMMMMKKEG